MDVISLPIELKGKKIDGRYMLVNAVSQRAREIVAGVYKDKTTKGSEAIIMALEDILSDDIEILTGAQAKQAVEESKKTSYERMLDESTKAETLSAEDLSELEKELKVYLNEKGGGKESRLSIDEIFDVKSEE